VRNVNVAENFSYFSRIRKCASTLRDDWLDDDLRPFPDRSISSIFARWSTVTPSLQFGRSLLGICGLLVPGLAARDNVGNSGFGKRTSVASLGSRATEDGELFLEQVVKRLASIIRPGRGKTSRSVRRRSGYGRRSRILFDSRAEGVKGAVVASIFFGNTLGYRPGALKLSRSIEIRALFTAMQLETTTRAGPLGIKAGLQNGAAI
jgi:hypothetical protein